MCDLDVKIAEHELGYPIGQSRHSSIRSTRKISGKMVKARFSTVDVRAMVICDSVDVVCFFGRSLLCLFARSERTNVSSPSHAI